ncbi:hypothetical protein DY000_02006325 [Brassica cretica]|uniref:Uncharacterized protein n=1 Tax=Brassica cretica TaxID=69181 RepID=A0ABQ7CBC1_BRACR|nr:hypothetical protein DY000_02006325 [Brassica cretica]
MLTLPILSQHLEKVGKGFGTQKSGLGSRPRSTKNCEPLALDCLGWDSEGLYSTWRRFCSSEEISVLVETSSSGDQSRRGSTCEGQERVRNAEVGFGGPVTWKLDNGKRPGLTK